VCSYFFVQTREARGVGAGRHSRPEPAELPAPRCAPRADFERSFQRLQLAIQGACRHHDEWQAKIAAGVNAVLEFAPAEPAAARELTAHGAYSSRRADEVTAYFVRLLGEVAPAPRLSPGTTAEALVECVATLVRGRLIGGGTEGLPSLTPELVSLVLLPYAGSEVAGAWAARFAQDVADGTK
jgi:hypothetical protein